MQSPLNVLARIQPLANSPAFAEAESFLNSPNARFHIDGGSSVVPASAVVHAWGTRLDIARRKGRAPTPGCEYLVHTVSTLPKEEPLECALFERGADFACFWFLQKSGDPVGFIIAAADDAAEDQTAEPAPFQKSGL